MFFKFNQKISSAHTYICVGKEKIKKMNNSNCNDSTIEGEMNIDNIFFYEDNNDTSQDVGMSSTSQRVQMKMNGNEVHESTSAATLQVKHHKRQKDSKYTQIKVNVGIDEHLKMILEMVIEIKKHLAKKVVRP